MTTAKDVVRVRNVALVALVVSAVGLSQLLRPRPGHKEPSGAGTVLLAPLGALWLAGGIVDSITGAVGWAVGPIWDAVRRLVDGVVGWVTDWVNHVIDWAQRAFDGLWGFVESLNTWAHDIAGWVGAEWNRVSGWIGGAVDRVTSWVGGRIGDTVNWALGELNKVYGYARQIVDDARTWVVDNVWRPLHDSITGAVAWVSNTVLPWVRDQLDGLTAWTRGLVDWVGQRAHDLVQGVLDVVGPVVQIVHGAWGWLEWFAGHTFDWMVGLWHELADSHPQVIEDMVGRGFDGGAGHLEDAVLRWFE